MAARRAPHRLCLGCEQTCRAQVRKQRVERRDGVLGAGRVRDCRGYACVSGTGGPLRPGGTDRPLRSVAADKTLRTGRTGRTGRTLRSGRADSTRCTDRADRPLRPGRGDVKRKVAITLKNQGEIKNKRLSHYAESRPGKTGRLFCVVGLERRKILLVEN